MSEGVTLHDALPPMVVSVAGAGVVLLIAAFLLRGDFLKGGLAAAVVVFMLFSYGPLSTVVRDWKLGSSRVLPAPVIVVIFLALGAIAIRAVTRASPQRAAGLTRGLNFVTAGLVAINALSIATFQIRDDGIGADTSGVLSAAATGSTPAGKPDIYFIVLDDYGGERAMKELLGYDNRPFLDALERRGFYVPAHPTTNYPQTTLYLASTLNLEYVHRLVKPGSPITYQKLKPLITDDLVPKFLKSKGYRYIHIGSWVRSTASNPQADVNITLGDGLSDFSNALLEQAELQSTLKRLGYPAWSRQQYDRALFQFDQLARSRGLRGPKFVFGHIIVPHWPYVFDENGQFSDTRIPMSAIKAPLAEVSRDSRERYIEQLEFANQKTLALIDSLLAGPPESRPVIVLQSDEGFFTWLLSPATANDLDLQQHFNILSAYYFPRLQRTGLYPRITPVNTFRLLFNNYFEAKLPLLPDRNYVLIHGKSGDYFRDVTQRVQPLV
ncbi:MAG TPA: sulfatase-like hydrolase/transferase [Actinomycetota bacterium]